MSWLSNFINHIQTILGAPNYDQYVAYMIKHHPGKIILDKKTFYQQKLQDRYESGKINRCC